MSYLLDTCVVSELTKRLRSTSVVKWYDSVSSSDLFVSVLTLGEIRKGIQKLEDERRRQRLILWLETELPHWFDGRVIPIDAGIADTWGRMQAVSPRTISAIDGLIAATALYHRLTVVTRNVSDFVPSGAPIINPWAR